MIDRFEVGDFLSETLVTDIRVYVVVSRTPKTICIAATRTTDEVLESNGAPFPTVWRAEEAVEGRETKTLRIRKDGSFRTYEGANRLRPARLIDGRPVSKVDYSF